MLETEEDEEEEGVYPGVVLLHPSQPEVAKIMSAEPVSRIIE